MSILNTGGFAAFFVRLKFLSNKTTVVFFPLVFWIAIVALSLAWNIGYVNESMTITIRSIGQAFFREIETTRLWNAQHGGVYVLVTESTRPNQYLDIPDRDITTLDGLHLTKVNPAFMTRQISEIAQQQNNVRYHITSLNPIRPENRADGWESDALRQFEQGATEVLDLVYNLAPGTDNAQSIPTYRYMAPLQVTSSCLKCHSRQGYQTGDIRGGISINIPASEYLYTMQRSRNSLIAIHISVMFLG
ncbi:MAG: DUF3365 domain-containing protein, partial [Desulfamplus sp.]|nr:DUF3365 domain-containing protein [Desulfamplus sp.]